MIEKKIKKMKTTFCALIILILLVGSSTCHAFNVQSLREGFKALARQMKVYLFKEPQNTRVLKKSADKTTEQFRMPIGPQIRQSAHIINNKKNKNDEDDLAQRNDSTELVYFRQNNSEIICIPKNHAEYLSGQGYGEILQDIDLRVNGRVAK